MSDKELFRQALDSEGKYTVVQDSNGKYSVLRHGEDWLDLHNSPGGRAILAAAYSIADLTERLEPRAPTQDTVRVLRLVEYTGNRSWVEEAVKSAIHGTKTIPGKGKITAVTLNEFPEVLEKAREQEDDGNRER